MGDSKKKANLDTSDETRPFQERIDEVRGLVEENLRYTKSIQQSGNGGNLKDQQELHKLLKENLRISKDLYAMTKKINKWIVWQRVWGAVKILIIVIPIILASLYLPPLLAKVIQPYQEILDFTKDPVEAISPGLIEQFTGKLKGDDSN